MIRLWQKDKLLPSFRRQRGGIVIRFFSSIEWRNSLSIGRLRWRREVILVGLIICPTCHHF
jgi:hypothetical protein